MGEKKRTRTAVDSDRVRTVTAHRDSRKKRRQRRRAAVIVLAAVAAVSLAALLIGSFYRVPEDLDTLEYPRPYRDTVSREAKENGIPESLVYAVMKAESGFDPDAESPAGAYGLMQIAEITFDWIRPMRGDDFSIDALFDPETNIEYGCMCLGILMEMFGGETETVLAAYNAGMGNVAEWLSNSAYSDDGRTLHTIPFGETAAYVEKVMEYKTSYDREYYGG